MLISSLSVETPFKAPEEGGYFFFPDSPYYFFLAAVVNAEGPFWGGGTATLIQLLPHNPTSTQCYIPYNQ